MLNSYPFPIAYDRNAIRVDNLRGEKVGHIKATMAMKLTTVMDRSIQLGVRLDGTIPRKGNAYTVSVIFFYGALHLHISFALVNCVDYFHSCSMEFVIWGGDTASSRA